MHHSAMAGSGSPLDRLIRATGRKNYSKLSSVYKTCYDIGEPLVPQIVERISAVNWKDLGRHGRVEYFTCLMSLLHDIDETASRDLAAALLRRGCHPVVAARLGSIQAFTLSDFDMRTLHSLPIFVAKTISRRLDAWRHLGVWLGHISPEDLEGIHRLYVIEKGRLTGAWGTYLTLFSVISLAWWPSHAWNRFASLQTEFTLYHEIGHHQDRRRGGLMETYEAFADTYAERIFRKAHPWAGKRWLRIFLMPSHEIRKLRRVWRINQSRRSEGDEPWDAS